MISRVKALALPRFMRNVAIVATGTAGAQAITLAFAPIITRLYGPETFGMFGTYMAILGMITPMAALTYPIAIVLPKSDTDAKNLARLSATLALLISTITAIVILVAGDWIALALGLEAIASFLLLIPIAMLFSAYQEILTQWLIRKKQFKISASVSVIKSLTINCSQVSVGWFYPMSVTLIVIATIGYAFHTALLWSGILNRETAHPNKDESTGTVRELAKRHRDFPLYRAPQVALNALTQSLPVLVLASMYGSATAGLFALTKSSLTAPANLIGTSFGNVFYPEAVELQGKYVDLHRFLLKTTVSLLFLAVIVFSPVLLLGPWIFAMIFGAEWEKAGEFGRWVSLWMVFSLAARPAINVIPVMCMQKSLLLFELIFFPIKIASLYLGVFLGDEIGAVALYCVSSCVFYIGLYLLIYLKIYQQTI